MKRSGAGRFWLPAAVGLSVAVSGPPTAYAQSAGPADTLLETLQLKARLAPAPPFVAKGAASAPGGFIPAGRTGPARSIKPMNPEELAAATRDLDAARVGQQRRAGRTPAVVPDKATRPAGESAR